MCWFYKCMELVKAVQVMVATVFVCVGLCVRERGGEKRRETDGQTEIQTDRQAEISTNLVILVTYNSNHQDKESSINFKANLSEMRGHTCLMDWRL